MICRTSPRDDIGDRDRGAVAILAALFVVLGMVLLAFVVDRGQVYVARTQLQNAVDAAALAAGQELCTNNAGAPGVAVDYGKANGLAASAMLVSTPVSVSGDAYMNVRASQQLTSFFAGFVGSTGTSVAAQATVSRDYTTKFQFVADNWFLYTSNVVLNAPIFAGLCFNGGSQSTYNSTIAVSSVATFDCNTINNNFGTDPITLGTQPTIGSGFERRYNETSITTSGTYAGTWAYGYTGATPQTKTGYTPNVGACGTYNGTFTGVVSCSGSQVLQIKSSDVVGDSNKQPDFVLASADITMGSAAKNDCSTPAKTGFGTDNILIYSSSSSSGNTAAITLPDCVPENVIVYAPNGQVRFTGAGANMKGTVLAKEIRTSGGGASASLGVDVNFAGDWRLVQ